MPSPLAKMIKWNEVFAAVSIVSTILDRVLYQRQYVNIKGKSYELKEHKECMT